MTEYADRFLKPRTREQRRYEALRARFVDGCSTAEAAARFGYASGTFRNLCSEFMRSDDVHFFLAKKKRKSPAVQEAPPLATRRRDRIIELRTTRGLSIYEIADILKKEGMPASTPHIHGVLKAARLPKLPRRPLAARMEAVRPERAALADRDALDLSPRRLRTDFGGLFLFAHDLARLDLDQLLADSAMPGSAMIPAGCAFRALLALKLWGIGRPSQVMAWTLDPGLALFASLNVIPKRATLSEYSCRVDPRSGPGLMRRWHDAVHGLGIPLGGGQSFDLDFHTIPYHGDDALVEKHFVSKRSRRQKGILAFLARDADARLFAYANAQVRKAGQNDEILCFVEDSKDRTGTAPAELVFDSRLTTYANLARLERMGIAFLTLRRRSKAMVAALLARPPSDWRRITLNNIGRIYRTPRILEQTVRLKDYPKDIRQIAIADLGHEAPTLLITNQMKTPAPRLIDRYARRMVIENTIAEAIDFFHMDALSASVPMKVDLDLQLTLMASALYRILAARVGNGFETARARTIFRKLIHASADIQITPAEIIVKLGRRANNPQLIAAGYADYAEPIPWLGNRTLVIRFV